MSLLHVCRRSPLLCSFYRARFYAAKVSSSPKGALDAEAQSSCPPNTVLTGINYLKDQPSVVALPDEEYPPWLWTLLEKKELPDDGPGGKAEKVRLRKENRQRIREQNFLKTQ